MNSISPNAANGGPEGHSSGDLSDSTLMYDWNAAEKYGPIIHKRFQLHDETLRDGLQSPSVVDPSLDDKLRILHLLDSLGVDSCDIGLPGAGPRAVEAVTVLAREIRDCKLRIRPTAAARTHVNDVRPIVEISQSLGMEIEVMAFIGSSPIRQYAEGWDLNLILQRSAESIDLGVKNGLPVTYVTEDTTRSRPEVLTQLFRNAIEHGATRLCLCDTVGHVTPDGTHNLIRFTQSVISGMGRPVAIDWHGHNDRGLGVCNALYALEFGADRVHGSILGIGERVGNAALDQILLNLKLLDELPGRDLRNLLECCRLVSEATRFPISANYPLAGSDAFRTATGVHAAAIIKAQRKGHEFLADRIYSGVPAGMFGREQEIEIGPMSGESNVAYWLERRGVPSNSDLARHILGAAKRTDHLLGEQEIRALIEEYGRGGGDSASLPTS